MSSTTSFNPGTTEGRQRLEQQLQRAQREFVAAIERGAGGLRAHERFATAMDGIVQEIVAAGLGDRSMPVAVAALGGYGRRAQCLYSDIDLLIVFGGPIGPAEEQVVKAVLHPLWDLRLNVGHHVRTVADFDHPEPDNPEYVLALLDARPLAGDLAVFEDAQRRGQRPPSMRHAEIREAIDQLLPERHSRFNDTIYQLEPDVKDAPGALRDIAASRVLRASAKAPGSADVIDDDRLEQAEDFFLRLRSLLHLEHGRNVNVLSHEQQEKAAERLRFPGVQSQQRVEALMGTYFRHARHVARALDRARRLPAVGAGDAPEALGLNLVRVGDAVSFADLDRAAGEPASWVHACAAAKARGLRVADEALDLFERNGARYGTAEILPTPDDRQQLLDLLRPAPGLYERLSEMHDCGLLNAIFPEFKAITCRVIRDFYHKYTVDEHTLLTIRGVERLLSPDTRSRERFGSILSELLSPERLVLALLFHDVGKWKEENHAEESVRMVRPVLDRLWLPDDAKHDVEFLIAQHLQMSRVSQRRDTSDPSVIREFAGLVGTEERLKLLCLMTLVDIGAVSTDTLTPWKEEVLWRLYVDTYNHLTLGYGDDVIHGGQAAALQATRPGDLEEAELSRFLEGFPQRYLAMFDADRIYRHVRLSRDIHADEVHLFLEQNRDVWDLTVVTLDKPYLFSNISGVLAYYGMDILRGSAMTNPAGLVLDVFQFTDHEGFFRFNPGATAQFERLLRDVVAGAQDVTRLLQRKEKGALYRAAPRRVSPIVYVDNEHSQRYTVLEIVAQNALGLLHRISRVVSHHGCDVDLVLISTEGNKAIDVFHLTKAAAKLSEPAQMALKEDLERMLEDGYEAH